jgi:uncharacterized protein YlxW (UPF0749 family)
VASGLLRDLLEEHLEPGYRAAAARRAEHPPSARARRLGQAARVAVLVALGALFATAYLQASASAPQAARTRAALASDARERGALTDRLQRQATAERGRLSAQRAQALRDSTAGSQAAASLHDLEVATSLTALRGAGLTVTVGDASQHQDPVTGRPAQSDPAGAGRVQDRDVAEVVNALWAAGAEAIAVDGQRLSPTSTIRSAGGAILVDFRPVSSPYQIRAIGNADRMQARFADSAVARSFVTFIDLYGMTFSIRRADALDLPAASATELNFAVPGGTPR